MQTICTFRKRHLICIKSAPHPAGMIQPMKASAIGRVGSSYYQNVKTLPEYYASRSPAISCLRERAGYSKVA